VYLPRSGADQDTVTKSDDLPMSTVGGRETLLFVDDDEAVRTVAVAALQSAGYRVIAARSGSDAVQSASALSSPPDLLVTDVVMPGLSGDEFARRLIERYRSVRVLYISGYTENAILHHGILQEGVELLQKPFTATELLRKVRSILDAKDEHSRSMTETRQGQ